MQAQTEGGSRWPRKERTQLGFETQRLRLDLFAWHLLHVSGHIFVFFKPVISTMRVRSLAPSFGDLLSDTHYFKLSWGSPVDVEGSLVTWDDL